MRRIMRKEWLSLWPMNLDSAEEFIFLGCIEILAPNE